MPRERPPRFNVTLSIVLAVGLLPFACSHGPQREAPEAAGKPPAAPTGARGEAAPPLPAPSAAMANPPPQAPTGTVAKSPAPAPVGAAASLPTPDEVKTVLWVRASDAACDCGPQHFSGIPEAAPAVEAWGAYLHPDDPFRGRWAGAWDNTWRMELIFPDQASGGAVPFRYRWIEDPTSDRWQESSGTLQRGRGYAAAGDVVLLSVIEKYIDDRRGHRHRILAVGSFSHRRIALLHAVGSDGFFAAREVEPAGALPITESLTVMD